MILSKDEVGRLLSECAKQPETYNEVANTLWEKLNIHDAVTTLLCTYGIIHIRDTISHTAEATAEWVPMGHDFYKCSHCGRVVYSDSIEVLGRDNLWCGSCGHSMCLQVEGKK